MKNIIGEISVLFSYPKYLVVLAVRWVLAYGFIQPTLMKLQNMDETAEWFALLHIPFSTVMTYIVTVFEAMGVAFLILGLFTRYIATALAFVMIGAIFFVHLPNGFSVAHNGFEIPLYYLLFLLFLASYGGGKYALDYLFFCKGVEDE